MGRHSAPHPPAEAPQQREQEPALRSVEFATVPWVQSPGSSSAPTWTPAHRPMPAQAAASADRHHPTRAAAPAGRTDAVRVLPPEHRPVRAAGTPSTDAIPVQLPRWDAPSLSTGPIATTPARARGGSRRVRIGLGIATVAVAASVVTQIVALRAGAPEQQPVPFDGSGVAATSPLPQTVGGGAILTTRP